MKYNEVKEVEIELTGLCNLHCPMCTRNFSHTRHLRKHHERSISEITNQLNQFTNLELLYIAGSSSEPTMYHDFFELIKYAKARGVKIELYVNGNTHNAEWWKELSLLLTSEDEVYFAIAGETQELHEKYRIGSNLQEILTNAEAFRSDTKNDILQFIRFEYNRHSLNTKALEDIVKPFKELFIVDSEIKRNDHHYMRSMPHDIMPYKERHDKLKALMDIRPKQGEGIIEALCIEQGSIFIDQFGNISGCYSYAKEAPALHEEDGCIIFDPIINFDNEVCLKCEKRMRSLTTKLDLEYIY